MLGSFGGFLFSFLGNLVGFLFGFLFSLLGSLASFLARFALFFRESLLGFFGGFGSLFFEFFGGFGGFHLLDGVAVSVEFDGLRGLRGLQSLGHGGAFLEFEHQGRGIELSDNETTDSFAIEILTFAREHGNDDVDEFVADLGSHVVRHFREALFHDGVRGKSNGSSVGISRVHCFVIGLVL